MTIASFQPGDLIGGRYRLNRLIGAGAMGAVWSARNESTDRDFALKLMLPDAAQNPVALQRFFQEAKASGRLRHRCIIEVYDLGRIEPTNQNPNDPRAGTPYLVMELLEGEPLDAILKRVKKLPVGTVLKMIRDIALGLDVAHRQRIIHRDLKPGNLFLHRSIEGEIVPKVLDFGISKLIGASTFDHVATSAGTVLGSPAYMSPEQAAGELDVDGRSDVWSLGVIMYKCLCGSVPFQAANYNALMKAIMMLPQQPIEERIEGLPRGVSEIVTKSLNKNREDRFESAKALADAIDDILRANATLPEVNLNSVVTLPVELSSDDVRTIALQSIAPEDGGNGTLAAQELAGARSSQPLPTHDINAHAIGKPAPARRKSPLPLVAGVMGAALAVGVGVAIVVVRMDHNSVDAKTVGAQTSIIAPSATSSASAAPSRVVVAPIEATSVIPSAPADSSTASAGNLATKPIVMGVPLTNVPVTMMRPVGPTTKPPPTKPPPPPANTGGNSRDNPGF